MVSHIPVPGWVLLYHIPVPILVALPSVPKGQRSYLLPHRIPQCESGELAPQETFTTLADAKILIEQWRKECNQVRPHSSLGYRPPALEAVQSALMLGNLTLEVVY